MGLLRFIIPNNDAIKAHIALAYLPDEQVKEHTHALQICTDCRYTLCSCGNCHSEDCNQVCLIELRA